MSGIDHRIAFEPAPAVDSGTGRSGLIQSFLSQSIDNLEISSYHQLFSSPTKESLTVTSLYEISVV